MTSILVSFVGNQDPFAKNDTEGSIVTLVKHLKENNIELVQIQLIYTEETSVKAQETKEWLETLKIHCPIILLPTSEELSLDPVNQSLAVLNARKIIDDIKSGSVSFDIIECNASSGTPTLKSTWGIIQAAGYFQKLRVWQVRNPEKKQTNQSRVFEDNLKALKNEIDLRVIKQQISSYNYLGALTLLRSTNFNFQILEALCQYGHNRFSLSYDKAFSVINPFSTQIDPQLIRDISLLRQNNRPSILANVFFISLISLQNQEYAQFLTLLFSILENLLLYIVKDKLNLELCISGFKYKQSWQAISEYDNGQLVQYLTEKSKNKLDTSRIVNRYILMDILKFYPQFNQIVPILDKINKYCQKRNDYIHQLIGVSEIENQDEIVASLRKVFKYIGQDVSTNHYDLLNDEIFKQLDQHIFVD